MIKILKKKRKLDKTTVIKLGCALLCIGFMCFFQNEIPSKAAGEISQIMIAERNAPMKAEPDIDAETIMNYEKGAFVFAIGETADGWYRVIYQDKEGYVQKEMLSIQEIDVEGLNAEMAVNEEESKMVVEAVEKYREEARRSKIWGGIIIVLVVGIFAVGIFSSFKTKKNNGENRLKKIKIEDWN